MRRSGRGRDGVGGVAKHRNLRHEIESAVNKHPTVDELVNHLRSSNPHYARHKLQPFTKLVERILSRIMDDGDTPITKRRKTTDAHHSLRHGASSSVDFGGSSDEADKSEPEFDLMKLIRRSSSNKSSDLGEMEMEVVDNTNREVSSLRMTNGNGEEGGKLSNADGLSFNNKNNINSNHSMTGKMFSDFGGIDGVIKLLIRKVIVPFHHPELPRHLGVKPITGILLHGPPGCGKTSLAEAIANETGVPFHSVSAAALVSGVSGASEENIRELFSKANRTAPSVIFIDEIDAIASKRENSRGMELRLVSQLLTCMDESRNLVKLVDDNCRRGYVLVIGATNRPDALDPALRRAGRFDHEIFLSAPDESARLQILSKFVCNIKAEGLDLVKIARSTPGFVGADLEAVVDTAGNIALNKTIDKREVKHFKEQKDGAFNDYWRQPISNEDLENSIITMADFEEAVKTVQPSCGREGFSDIPNVKWDDVGGLHFLRQEFDRHIIRRIKFPEVYRNIGLNLEAGFLLYGPPGCGKTLIAKAVANEAGASFIHIKGPELLSKYVGDSELSVRSIFSRARKCSPCILFFDEMDGLTTMRGKEGGSVVERVLDQLLVELDGADDRKGIFVIGATNRPDLMDSALIRPGRMEKLLYVPLPSPDERGMILKSLARNKPIDANVDLMAIGKDKACDNFSGADLSALINEALLIALDEQSCKDLCSAKDAHFERALGKISPSVSEEQIKFYNHLSKTLKAS